MTISVTCPECESLFNLSDALEGKKVRCKKCGETIVVRRAAGKKAARKTADEDDTDESTEVEQRLTAAPGARPVRSAGPGMKTRTSRAPAGGGADSKTRTRMMRTTARSGTGSAAGKAARRRRPSFRG